MQIRSFGLVQVLIFFWILGFQSEAKKGQFARKQKNTKMAAILEYASVRGRLFNFQSIAVDYL